MRILIAHPSNDLYGSDRMLLRTATALGQRGHEVVVALPENGELAGAIGEFGIQVVEAPTLILQKRLLALSSIVKLPILLIWSLLRALRTIRKLRPEVLYVNTITIPAWLIAGRLSRVPTVVHVREAENLSYLLRKAILSPLLAANKVLVNSKATAENVVSAVRVLETRTSVVYNGMKFPAASPSVARPEHNIVLVGRLSPRKGQDVAVEALSIMRRSGMHVNLTLAGDSYEGYEWFKRSLEDRAEELGVLENITFAGFIRDVWPVYESASICIVPSRVEPFGNVAVEAMAMRRPVVASRVQGLAEIIEDGVTGLLVAPESATALAAACRKLTDHPELAEEISRAAEEAARRRFGLGRYADAMAGHLECIARKRTGGRVA